MAGLESYDIKQKHDWRHWAWRRSIERIPEFAAKKRFDPSKMNNQDRSVCAGKTAVYLCGPDDFDREVALRYGFSSENVFAVDVNEEFTARVRQSRAPAVSGYLDDVLVGWGKWRHIDVVIADLCCGFDVTAQRVLQGILACESISNESVCVINLQRGRDAYSNDVRATSENKHRGRHWLLQIATVAASAELYASGRGWNWKPADSKQDAWYRAMYSEIVNGLHPCINSYVAKKNRMDSAVCRVPFMSAAAKDAVRKYRANTLANVNASADAGMARRLAAMKAVSTMRNRGYIASAARN